MSGNTNGWGDRWSRLLPSDFGKWLFSRFLIYLTVAGLVAVSVLAVAALIAGNLWWFSGLIAGAIGAAWLVTHEWNEQFVRLRH
jgi:hypothetical protein